MKERGVCSAVSLLFVGLLLVGCNSPVSQSGVVARLNGEPIYLSQLESEYDLVYMDWSSSNDFDVDFLKKEYGNVLGNLILQLLIRQTLAEEGLLVSDDDVAKAEAVIRADYPDKESFEQTLIEEYIDIEQWRKSLRARMTTEKFLLEYLRPQVTITYEAASAYYREHIADFLLPERFVFTVFESNDLAALDAAVDAYMLHKKNNEDGFKKSGEVDIHAFDAPLNSLSPAWKKILLELEPGQKSKALKTKDMMTVLYLEKRMDEMVLAPSKAYPSIEKMLVAQRVRDLFDAWVQKVSVKAKIEITPLLEKQGKNVVPSSVS